MVRFAFLLILFIAVLPAQAVDRLTAGARLAATCANCHGTEGVSAGGNFTSLAGWKKNAMLEELREFRSPNTHATLMHQLVKGYSDEELVLIAEYFASRPRPPKANKNK